MRSLNLPVCPFLGPPPEGKPHKIRDLPEDCEVNPFKYLPPRIALSEEELKLAAQYERGDFSGGYAPSQIARFRRGPSAEMHLRRRERFRELKIDAERRKVVLPESFVQLVESDDYVSRLRHNSIAIRLPDELVALPSDPNLVLFLIFGEGQGCGFWHLLLDPDGSHVVVFSEHPFGLRDVYSSGYQPDLASIKIYQCAKSFSQWIVNFFAESIQEDQHYERVLKRHKAW